MARTPTATADKPAESAAVTIPDLAGLLKPVTDATPVKRPAPAVTAEIQALADAITKSDPTPQYLPLSAMSDEALKLVTKILRGNAATLFPGKSLRITFGEVEKVKVVQFKLGEPRKAAEKK